MDKGTKDNLVRSPGENGGGQDAQKDPHLRTRRDETKGKTQERWNKEAEREHQVLGVRRWRELVREKNGRILFERPKPTVGYSANGRKKYCYKSFTTNDIRNINTFCLQLCCLTE